MSEAMLAKELETYEKQRETLLGTSKGKYVLIKADRVLGVYENEVDAVNQGYATLGNVPFLVKRIEEFEIPMNFTSFKIAL